MTNRVSAAHRRRGLVRAAQRRGEGRCGAWRTSRICQRGGRRHGGMKPAGFIPDLIQRVPEPEAVSTSKVPATEVSETETLGPGSLGPGSLGPKSLIFGTQVFGTQVFGTQVFGTQVFGTQAFRNRISGTETRTWQRRQGPRARAGADEHPQTAGAVTQERESSDSPMLKAFWRVAPSERFSFLAIFAAGVFPRAIVFSSRTSAGVQDRRFFAFFGIIPPVQERQVASHSGEWKKTQQMRLRSLKIAAALLSSRTLSSLTMSPHAVTTHNRPTHSPDTSDQLRNYFVRSLLATYCKGSKCNL